MKFTHKLCLLLFCFTVYISSAQTMESIVKGNNCFYNVDIDKKSLVNQFITKAFNFRRKDGCCEGYMFNDTLGECTGKLEI